MRKGKVPVAHSGPPIHDASEAIILPREVTCRSDCEWLAENSMGPRCATRIRRLPGGFSGLRIAIGWIRLWLASDRVQNTALESEPRFIRELHAMFYANLRDPIPQI